MKRRLFQFDITEDGVKVRNFNWTSSLQRNRKKTMNNIYETLSDLPENDLPSISPQEMNQLKQTILTKNEATPYAFNRKADYVTTIKIPLGETAAFGNECKQTEKIRRLYKTATLDCKLLIDTLEFLVNDQFVKAIPIYPDLIEIDAPCSTRRINVKKTKSDHGLKFSFDEGENSIPLV
jgi:hypothetical protein